MLEPLALMLALGAAGLRDLGPALLPAALPASSLGVAAAGAEPVFLAEERAVSNWREATRSTLEPAPLAIAAALFVSGRPVVTRCVKLNNPWCIKRARWSGELGGDDEGHTAFATTEAGADAAASLLRTYYVSLGRRSALDIVRRWAPAECRIGDGAGLPAVLAVRGLANTLRARFLASRSRTGTAQPRPARGKRAAGGGRVRVSSVPLAPMPSFRVPDIAAGMGERPSRVAERPPARANASRPEPARKVAPVRSAAAAPASIPAPPKVFSCDSAEGRIQNYGSAIARALGVSPSDDLKLFDAAGEPTANLLPVMVAMSAIELGYLHAGPELVERAVERLRLRLAAAAAATPASAAAAE